MVTSLFVSIKSGAAVHRAEFIHGEARNESHGEKEKKKKNEKTMYNILQHRGWAHLHAFGGSEWPQGSVAGGDKCPTTRDLQGTLSLHGWR